MPTYYRDDRVRITSSEVRVDGAGYAIDDLPYVWHARGRPDARALLRRTGRWLLVAAALALVAACAGPVPARRPGAQPGGTGRAGHRRVPRLPGGGVRRTSDALLFGRVYRALARAIENRP